MNKRLLSKNENYTKNSMGLDSLHRLKKEGRKMKIVKYMSNSQFTHLNDTPKLMYTISLISERLSRFSNQKIFDKKRRFRLSIAKLRYYCFLDLD